MLIPAKPLFRPGVLFSSGSFDMGAARAKRKAWFTRRGRDAILHGISMLGLEKGDQVLAPGYICGSALSPFAARGIETVFYDLTPGLNADLADIESKVTKKTRALFVVHYFGFPQDMAAITGFCASRGLKLIEDCAHAFMGMAREEPVGSFGDIAVFSLRKSLPVSYGGVLLACSKGEFTEKERLSESVSGLLRMIAEAAVFKAGFPNPYRIKDSRERAEKTEHEAFCEEAGRAPSYLTSKTAASFKGLAHRRRRNFLRYNDALGSRALSGPGPLFPELAEGVVPMAYPLWTQRAKETARALRNTGIGAYMWPGAEMPELGTARCDQSVDLAGKIVLLPLHQDIEERHIEHVVDSLRRFS